MEKRKRTLTSKGLIMYSESKDDFCKRIEKAERSLKETNSKIQDCANDLKQLDKLEANLQQNYNSLCQVSKDYENFLSTTNTEQSVKDLEIHSKQLEHYKNVFEAGQQHINFLRAQSKITGPTSPFDVSNDPVPAANGNPFIDKRLSSRSKNSSSVGSVTSSILGSKISNASKISSLIALKLARAEAAKARVHYAEKEAMLTKQKAGLEADLSILAHRKEAAAAEAEVQALQTLEEGSIRSVNSRECDPVRRTQEYVLQHAMFPNSNELGKHNDRQQHKIETFPGDRPIDTTHGIHNYHPLNIDAMSYHPIEMENPFNERCISNTKADHENREVTSELAKFLLKKDLLLSRLTQFSDRPEAYASWKASFKNVMNELSVSTTEEIDLLIKWLGPDSKHHAISIRSANTRNPFIGLNRIWERLNERYGAPEMVEAALKDKLSKFPKLTTRDNVKLYELSDILSEIEAVKDDPVYHFLFSYYDSSAGINPIVNKLPYSLQEKWTTRASNFKSKYNVSFPPFSEFSKFIREISKIRNDPGFKYEMNITTQSAYSPRVRDSSKNVSNRPMISTRKTNLRDITGFCPMHKKNHSLNQCRGFRLKPIQERKKLLKDDDICFRCCASNSHKARDCRETIKCEICESSRHPSALHIDNYEVTYSQKPSDDGGEKSKSIAPVITPKCTQICGTENTSFSKSCAKLILVKIYSRFSPDNFTNGYAILDKQINRSLASPKLFQLLGIETEEIQYTLSSCSGTVVTSGRRGDGCMVQSLDGNTTLELPTLIECREIPNVREEIPTPGAAFHHPHLRDVPIPPLDNNADILLLIGGDITDAHHVLDQRTGPRHSPYAQRLSLGWVIVGEVCLGNTHVPNKVCVNKTNILSNGRPSILEPCQNNFTVEETSSCDMNCSLFALTKEDDKPAMSIEDREFLKIMDGEFEKQSNGNWIAPLPFKTTRPELPNNRTQALKRAELLHKNLQRNSLKRAHFIAFMQKIFENGHAEIAPAVEINEECWYLPVFGVYHPKKRDQIRGVFDSSARFNGVSLNDILLTGPDMINSLLGILLRFRREPIAIRADIQQMFYCFFVREDHRNYLRFFWYRDNDPEKDLIEYRMCVHVFGNSPSPAIATYGLQKTAQNSENKFGSDVKHFVTHDFYVDDGLTSLSTSEEAIDLMRTQAALSAEGNLRLHKITSNSNEVMNAFPSEDLAKDLKHINLNKDDLPVQHSLGLNWDLQEDAFTFQVSSEEKPYTRRGVLSTINSLYDPLGFLAPITIQGKILLRDLMADKTDWDEPLSSTKKLEWIKWKESLTTLEQVRIPRVYLQPSLCKTVKTELHVYSDASEKAIAAVAYIYTELSDGRKHLSFVLGKSKVAPKSGHTIPRLELCAAVLAVEISEIITEHLQIKSDVLRFFTDSRIVLGYIYNQTRRFFTYVSNRVQRIRKSSKPEQWNYVSTKKNPADAATRDLSCEQLLSSQWLSGPSILQNGEEYSNDSYPLLSPEEDKEVRPEINVNKTTVLQFGSLSSKRFERFSVWRKLVESIALLKHIANCKHEETNCKGWHICQDYRTVNSYAKAEQLIIKEVQYETYHREISCLINKTPILKDSPIVTLDPFLDQNDMLRVGGRINRSSLLSTEKNPLIIPGKHHIATLLIQQKHKQVKHQGRHLTEGAVRAAGFWIIGAKRLISNIIHRCIPCRKLRGRTECPKMSDLPPDRLIVGPAFTYVGVDTFGPWEVVTRRTRGGQANSKRWAVIFTCLTCRAVHIEVVDEMSSSSFINALRRFTSIRGKVKEFRSDRGTNFVGATDALKIDAVNVEEDLMKEYLYNNGCTWIFNAPHASHMGGVWERMIGLARRILNSLLSDVTAKTLTHDVLVTFMAEVCAIINARPLVAVSTDPENPEVLSPSMLLTQKTDLVTTSFVSIDPKDMFKAQWKRVQLLAEMFWRREYLQTLQKRPKWQTERPNLKTGDVILLKDSSAHRKEWPMGIVEKTLPSSDGRIRKVQIRVVKDDKPVLYTRPVTETVLLLSE